METVQTRYHEGLLAERARAWRLAVQTGKWQDWQAHSDLNARVHESRDVMRDCA